MDSFAVFTARGLRNRSGELLEDAEAGRVSLITNSGKPAILAIPFDDWILDHSVHRAMALNLFSSHQLTLAQSAKVAALSMEAFIELLGKVGVPAVDYPPEVLDDELTLAL